MDIQITTKKNEGVERRLEVTVPIETLRTAEAKTASQYASQARLPGVRPGKAPAAVIRKRFKDQIRQQVLETLVQDAFKEVIDREQLKVASQPHVHDLKFEEGQPLPSPYHRTKYESERIVREECSVPWRVYRPAVVVGHSETGAMDKVDGPYYFFPLFKRLRDTLPQWLPMLGVDLGDTNVVPVDYVAKAMDHLAHQPDLDGQAFHLVNPEPQPTVDLVNAFASAAKAPRFVPAVDRRVTGLLPTNLLPKALHLGPVQLALRETVGRLGVPPEVLGHVSFASLFAARRTLQALRGSGISCPDLDSYADRLWAYWEEHLDTSTARDKDVVEALEGRTLLSGLTTAPLVMPEVITGLSLLLLFVTFLFINAEVWHVASRLDGGVLWLVVLLFLALSWFGLFEQLPPWGRIAGVAIFFNAMWTRIRRAPAHSGCSTWLAMSGSGPTNTWTSIPARPACVAAAPMSRRPRTGTSRKPTAWTNMASIC